MNYSKESLSDWLKNEYLLDIDDRASRLSFLIHEYGHEGKIQFFHGAELTKQFFEESRWCFVNGQFVACVLLCQCFLENSLRSLFSGFGKNLGVTNKWIEESGFYELTQKAFEQGLISKSEAQDFHWIRQTRIQYVHPKPPFSKRYFAHRFLNERKAPPEIFAEDAKRAISVVLRLIQRPPFRY